MAHLTGCYDGIMDLGCVFKLANFGGKYGQNVVCRGLWGFVGNHGDKKIKGWVLDVSSEAGTRLCQSRGQFTARRRFAAKTNKKSSASSETLREPARVLHLGRRRYIDIIGKARWRP